MTQDAALEAIREAVYAIAQRHVSRGERVSEYREGPFGGVGEIISRKGDLCDMRDEIDRFLRFDAPKFLHSLERGEPDAS